MRPLLTLSVTVGILAATGGAIALMLQSDASLDIPEVTEPSWDVRTLTQTPDAHRPQIRLIGKVEPMLDVEELAMLNSEVESVPAVEGMPVEEGDILVRLDAFDARLQVSNTEADLEELETRRQLQASQQALDLEALKVEKASLALLEAKLKKQQSIGTQQTIDELEQQIQQQRFAVLQRSAAIGNHDINNRQLDVQQRKLELALSSARRQLEQATLKAPFSGILAKVYVKPGQRVNAGQPLFRLYSQEELTVTAQLPTSLLTEREVLDGTIRSQGRNSGITFDHAEAQLNPNQAGFNAWFRITDTESWLPGDIVEITLNTAARDNSLTLPPNAVFQDKWIYTVDDEQRLQAVEVDVLGSQKSADDNLLVVQPQTETNRELRVLLTRLNNPTTGMKVYEEGVDPAPVEVEDDASENEDDTADEVSDENA